MNHENDVPAQVNQAEGRVTTAEGRVTTDVQGHIFLVGLDRQSKKNALTFEMMHQLSDAYTEYDENPELRVAVLFGHGDAFSAGFDLGKLTSTIKDGGFPTFEGRIDPAGLTGKHLSKPLVVAIHGFCFAGGLEVALNGDIIVAAKGTRLGQPEVTRGVFAFGGGTVRWVERVGWGNAQRYLLTGDGLDADEAYRIGLVQELVEPAQVFDRAMDIATSIANAGPIGVRESLKSSHYFVEESRRAAFAYLPAQQLSTVSSADADEGSRSFFEKRKANFVGR